MFPDDDAPTNTNSNNNRNHKAWNGIRELTLNLSFPVTSPMLGDIEDIAGEKQRPGRAVVHIVKRKIYKSVQPVPENM